MVRTTSSVPPSRRTYLLVGLWLLGYVVFLVARVSHARPFLLSAVMVLWSLAAGYTLGLIRSGWVATTVAIAAFGAWLWLFLFARGVLL